MAKPEFKKPENVHVKQPASVADWLGDADRPPEPVLPPHDPLSTWAPIPELTDGAPFDGRPVLLTPDGVRSHAAAWKVTRAYSQATRRYDDVGFWVFHNGGTAKIPYAPVGWKPYVEPELAAARRRAV